MTDNVRARDSGVVETVKAEVEVEKREQVQMQNADNANNSPKSSPLCHP